MRFAEIFLQCSANSHGDPVGTTITKMLKNAGAFLINLYLMENGVYMNKFILILIVFCSHSVFAGVAPDFPFLLVKGEAEIKVQPDVAKISFSVTEFNKDAKAATTLISQRGQEVLSLANKFGIASEQVTSTAYAKDTKRRQGDHYEDLDILGYEVTQHFSLQVHNISQYSAFVDGLLMLPNVGNISADFDVSNRDQIESDLIKAATKNARKKANDLAAGMGIKVSSVFAVTQDYSLSSFEAVFGAPDYSTRYAPPEFAPPPALAFAPNSPGSNMFIPKTISIQKTVSVVYKIK